MYIYVHIHIHMRVYAKVLLRADTFGAVAQICIRQ